MYDRSEVIDVSARVREPVHKLVVDFPASVMDQLEQLKSREQGATIKGLILKAVELAYGIKPTGH